MAGRLLDKPGTLSSRAARRKRLALTIDVREQETRSRMGEKGKTRFQKRLQAATGLLQ